MDNGTDNQGPQKEDSVGADEAVQDEGYGILVCDRCGSEDIEQLSSNRAWWVCFGCGYLDCFEDYLKSLVPH